MTRKNIVLGLLGSLLLTTSALATELAVVPTSSSEFVQRFGDPNQSDRPMMRLWLPLAELTSDELRRSLTEISQKGFGGIEVGGFAVKGATAADYGWDSDPWNTAMKTILEIAAEPDINLRVDFMVGASYPAAVPETFAPADAVGTEKELAWGAVQVAGGEVFEASAPAPIRGQGKDTIPVEAELISVVAARLLPGQTVDVPRLGDANTQPILIDKSSVRILDLPANGEPLSFAAPEGEEWVITSFWLRGSGRTVPDITESTSVVVDHFSLAGTELWKNLWETELFSDAGTAELLKANGGSFFEDSLHLYTYQAWTEDLLKEFEARRGYDLTPYLPLILIPDLNNFFSATSVNADITRSAFEFADDTGERVRKDYYETLTELYVEYHIVPMREWAATKGMDLRFQPSYGQSLEQSQAVFEIDIPETESFQHGNQIDAFRYIAAAASAADRPVISTECCAERGMTNALTWEQTINLVERNYAGGVNNVVFHGYSYNISPDATWPGWIRFGQNSFSDNYGVQPNWQFVRPVADYLAREQTALRVGEPKLDVAVYRHSYWDMIRGGSRYFHDNDAMATGGFTYGFVSPAMLDRDNFALTDGKLDVEGAAYKALVLDNEESIPLETARRVKELADAGYPIIFVGQVPYKSAFQSEADADLEIGSLMSSITALENVRIIQSAGQVASTLPSLKVSPAAKPLSPTAFLSVHRNSNSEDLYYFFNAGNGSSTVRYALPHSAQPYKLDAWSGEITPISTYRTTEAGIELDITLEAGGTTIVGFTDNWSNGTVSSGLDLSRQEIQPVTLANGAAALRATELGQHPVTLGNEAQVVEANNLPSVSLGREWSLNVSSWEQADDRDPYTIAKVDSSHDLVSASGRLPAWEKIAGLEDVSGIGTYRGTITVDRWSDFSGAVLRLGTVEDTFSLSVNGTSVEGVNLRAPEVDISKYLQEGENAIEVLVGTTMRNRMRVITGDTNTPSTAPRQSYGLVGPVQVIPYQLVNVSQ